MHKNYQYQLDWANQQTGINRSAAILDYGCGAGEVVIAGRRDGLNIYGADIYYDGGSTLETVKKSGLFGKVIRKIDNGRLEFQDNYFDLVMSNQVFEHVDSLNPVLAEIHRTMKLGGKFLSIFPILETIPENHIGIPFAHWFPKENPLRLPFILIMRTWGFGAYKENLSASQWSKNQLDWLDRFTHYRGKREIMSGFKRYFKVTCFEEDYIRFRLARRSCLLDIGFFKSPSIKKITAHIFHRLAGMVILCEK